MAASVLNSARAIEVSVYVVRAFVSLREAAAGHRELSLRLDALRELMAPPDPPRRSIGFVLPEEKRGTHQAVRKIRVRSK